MAAVTNRNNTQADAQAISATGSTVAKDQALAVGGDGNHLGDSFSAATGGTINVQGAAGAEAIAQRFQQALSDQNAAQTAALDKILKSQPSAPDPNAVDSTAPDLKAAGSTAPDPKATDWSPVWLVGGLIALYYLFK